jgi:hypothetical protein
MLVYKIFGRLVFLKMDVIVASFTFTFTFTYTFFAQFDGVPHSLFAACFVT